MSTKYYCGRCEAEVPNGPGRFTVKIDRYTGEDELVEDDVVLDYCQRCVSKIEEKVPRMRSAQ